jgi:hypothetical protein
MQFNGTTNQGGVTFGAGSSTVSATSIPEQLYLISSGNVGIGTSTPSSRLVVNGGTSTSQIRWEVNNAAYTQEVSTNAAQNAYVYKSNDASYHVWKLGGSTAMTLDSSGRMLINLATSKTYGGQLQVLNNIQAIGGSSADSPLIASYDFNALDATPTYSSAVLRKFGSTAAGNLYFAAIAAAGWAEIGGINVQGGVAFGANGAVPLVFANSAERMRIDSSGNVQIGAASAPAAAGLRYLDVYNAENTSGNSGSVIRLVTRNVAGDADITVDLVKYKNGAFVISNNETNVAAYTAFNVGASERMRINSSGNVGIGGVPESKLHVFTTSAAGNAANQGVNISNADNTRQLLLGVNNTASTTWIQGWIPTVGSSNLVLQPTDGNVGIGASTSTQLRSQLTVLGAGQTTSYLTDAGATTGTIQINSSVNAVGRGGALTFGALLDNNSYTPFAAIKGLLVNGLGNGAGDLAFSTRYVTGDTALTERMRITSAGNVGIRTNSPVVSLDVFGNDVTYSTPMRAATTLSGAWYYGPGTAFDVFYVLSGTNNHGAYITNGADSWTPNISDARLKNKLGDIENALDAILKLKPLKYYFKDDEQSGTPRYGFFAQNVGEAIPDAMLVAPVTDHELGEVYTYSPDIINTHLVRAIQEQQVLIDDLTKRLESTPKLNESSADENSINNLTNQLASQLSTINQHQRFIDTQQSIIDQQQNVIEQQQKFIDDLILRVGTLESQVNQT